MTAGTVLIAAGKKARFGPSTALRRQAHLISASALMQ